MKALLKNYIYALFIISIFIQSASGEFFVDITIDNGYSPYQVNITLSDSTGVNTVSTIYLNGNAGTNFSSVYFTSTDGATTFNHYTDNTSGKTFINRTQNGTIRMWYGNLSRASSSNGSLTFPSFCCTGNSLNTSQWSTAGTVTVSNGAATLNAANEAMYSAQYYQTGYVFEANITASATNGNFHAGWGLCPECTTWNLDPANIKYSETRNTTITETNNGAYGTSEARYMIIWKNSSWVEFYYNNALQAIHSTAANIPDSQLNASFKVFTIATYTIQSAFVRYHPTTVPQITAVTSETEINYVPITASNTVRYSNDSAQFFNCGPPCELKRITISENYTGSIQISYISFGDSLPVYTQIFKNGVAYGTSHIDSSAQTYTQTFTNIDYLSGDVFSVYGNITSGGSGSVLNNFRLLFDYDYTNYTPTLITPANGSVTSFSFPPQFTDVYFEWTDAGDSGYQIQISEDEAFNLIEYDITTTTNTTQTMDAGTHYWRVRTYNSGVSGNWSDVFSFTLTESTPSLNGTAINGVVFEYIGGVQTPISGASVYLTNSTYTTQKLTSSNGYFLVTGLDNSSTYSLYSIKQGYDNSQTFFVSPANNTTTTVNLPMRIFISPFVPNFVFEKFIIRSLFDDPYSGVTVNIYVGSSLTPSFTGNTDSMGQVVFQLVKDNYYRFEASGGGISGTITDYFYGKEETYVITIASGFPDTGDKFEDINASLFVTQVNASFANLSLYYSDNSSTTTIINYYVRYFNNNTNVCADQSSAAYPVLMNCTVNMANLTYLFGWNATNTRYGFIQGADVVNFKTANVTAQLPGLQEKMGTNMLNWISILGLIFIAGLFSVKSVKFGVVIVPMTAVIMYWVGTLQVSAILVHSALVIGVLGYIRMSEQKVIQ